MSDVRSNAFCQRFDALFPFIVHETSGLICLASVLLKINLLLEYYRQSSLTKHAIHTQGPTQAYKRAYTNTQTLALTWETLLCSKNVLPVNTNL